MQADAKLLRFMGFNTQGDLAPWTFYTAKNKGLVWFVKSPPLEPPSVLQTTVRNAIRLNGYVWRSLLPSQRADWELASKRAHLKINGFNLFTYWNLSKDDAAIRTIEHQSSIDLIPLERRQH